MFNCNSFLLFKDVRYFWYSSYYFWFWFISHPSRVSQISQKSHDWRYSWETTSLYFLECFLQDYHVPTISNEDKANRGELLALNDLDNALKCHNWVSSPVSDGLTPFLINDSTPNLGHCLGNALFQSIKFAMTA